jgi:non-ribosomal peptide synthase protein (TIGR01720 family)
VPSVRRRLRAVPTNGFGFGALAYLTPESTLDRSPAPVVFNYLGQSDSGPSTADGLVEAVPGSLGQDHDPRNRRPHAVEVLGAAEDGRLHFAWLHRPDLVDRSTADAIAADFAAALQAIAAEIRSA